MKRLRTLLLGLLAGVAYALLCMLLVQWSHRTVSIGFVFALPLVMGALPVLLSTKAQLRSYLWYLLLPWGSVLLFFYLALLLELDGIICLAIIIAPFLVLGSLGAFVFRLIRLRQRGDRSPRLYLSLLLPLAVLGLEELHRPQDQYGTVSTQLLVTADRATVWENIKSVSNIQPQEIEPLLIHRIGVPKPLSGDLDRDGVGGIRHIRWEKGIRFREVITDWQEGEGFAYDIIINPEDIPPRTLDDHVMIGGQYFDVLRGSYRIDSLGPNLQRITLSS
ncbi:hypothetical protein, partial [Cesiribacter andamanensis]|uniref:hypothetical protein n=1 Tax=Cesiribacter andamanensis TaxID=649507 RepID=UPI0005909DA3